jgi:hypothetical protein
LLAHSRQYHRNKILQRVLYHLEIIRSLCCAAAMALFGVEFQTETDAGSHIIKRAALVCTFIYDTAAGLGQSLSAFKPVSTLEIYNFENKITCLLA